MPVTRREFMGGAAVGAASLGVWGWRPGSAWAEAEAAAAAAGHGRTLVVVQLAGGNDGLNTVIPFADPEYRKLRPNLALGESDQLRLDERVALHAALGRVREAFGQGRVAVVMGVGYPKPDRSHFTSTAIWQSARPDGMREGAGWLGRAVELEAKAASDSEVVPALGVGGGGLTPALYTNQKPLPALQSLEAFTVQADKRYPADAPALRGALQGLYERNGSRVLPAFVGDVGRTALDCGEALRAAVSGYTSEVAYPQGAFAANLKLVSQLIVADLGTRVFHLTLGGFDTHANQKPQQRALLTQLSDGLHAFFEDLRAHGRADRVAVMTYSEFGRRAQENASGGTDHGAASTMFVLGEKVAGGLHGPVPDLSHLENGDVPFAVDFRSVYASVLQQWLSVPPDKVLGGAFTTLPLFRG